MEDTKKRKSESAIEKEIENVDKKQKLLKIHLEDDSASEPIADGVVEADVVLCEGDSVVKLYKQYVTEQQSLRIFRSLQKQILPLMTHDMLRVAFANKVKSRRLVATVAEEADTFYRYYFAVDRKTCGCFSDFPFLDLLRKRMEKLTGHALNFAFINFCRPYDAQMHPDDHIGFYSDSKSEKMADSNVCSVSFGDTRHFAFRRIGESKICAQTPVGNGDVVLMCGTTQKTHQHAITKRGVKECTDGCFNITFRQQCSKK